jgi:hypothetical protein
MYTLDSILEEKKAKVFLTRNDILKEVESLDWRQKHPTGPVRVDIICKLCGAKLATDLREFGWLENDSFFARQLVPHLLEVHCG